MTVHKLVTIPNVKNLINRSPGFEKKALSTHKIDLLGLCEFGCRYCSSNTGNYLRINRRRFADLTENQVGERLLPVDDPSLTFAYSNVVEQLERELAGKRPGYGCGETLMFSMLTDGFSPHLVQDGTTEAVLSLLLQKTRFRIRVLTKSAVVGKSHWVEFFLRHRDRFVVGLSTGTLDNEWARKVEVGTSLPSARLRALHALQDAGVRTYGMACPIFPDVVIADQVDALIDQIRPDRVEDFWTEPFNNRVNWHHVRAGYAAESPGWQWFTEVYERGDMAKWSAYATGLYQAFRARGTAEGWIDKLHFMLYEHNVAARDVDSLGDMRGLMLQSPGDECGRSKNPEVRRLQDLSGCTTRPDHGIVGDAE